MPENEVLVRRDDYGSAIAIEVRGVTVLTLAGAASCSSTHPRSPLHPPPPETEPSRNIGETGECRLLPVYKVKT